MGLRDSRIGHRAGTTTLRDLSDTFLLTVKMYKLLRQEVILVSFLLSFAFWNVYLTICYRVKTTLLFILISNWIIEPQASALRLNIAFVVEACQMRVAGSVQQPPPHSVHKPSTQLASGHPLERSIRHRISPAEYSLHSVTLRDIQSEIYSVYESTGCAVNDRASFLPIRYQQSS